VSEISHQITGASRTFRLLASPSFGDGFSRALDIGATLQQYNEDATEAEADYKATLSDWQAAGDDIMAAVHRYEREQITTT